MLTYCILLLINFYLLGLPDGKERGDSEKQSDEEKDVRYKLRR